MNIRNLVIGGIATVFSVTGSIVTYDSINDVVVGELSFDTVEEMRVERVRLKDVIVSKTETSQELLDALLICEYEESDDCKQISSAALNKIEKSITGEETINPRSVGTYQRLIYQRFIQNCPFDIDPSKNRWEQIKTANIEAINSDQFKKAFPNYVHPENATGCLDL